MYDMGKSIVFALAMCVVCGLLLTTAATALNPLQERNRENDRRKNVLLAVELVTRGEAYTHEEISRIYNENISIFGVTRTGQIVDAEHMDRDPVLPLYLYLQNNTINAYIVPIETRGVWGMIYGYIALDDDGSTIRGFTITQHSETPGLGGEIERQWFQENFVGKRIADRDGEFVSIRVARGDVERQVPEEARPHYVDGISGATLTGQFLREGLRNILARYEPLSIRFRQDQIDRLDQD
jgi:Na+-transporting NADH:ubiquinone oxidoreductase subunit C